MDKIFSGVAVSCDRYMFFMIFSVFANYWNFDSPADYIISSYLLYVLLISARGLAPSENMDIKH